MNPMKQHIHVFGASGSGTTTIAQRVSHLLGYPHFDADDYFWLPTKDPFTVERPQNDCLRRLNEDLQSYEKWILSGSLTGWGDVFIPLFDLVVFVYVPQPIRLERLRQREYERYGDAILPGGNRHESCEDFLQWAAAYDAGTRNGRSLPKHEAWLEGLNCTVLRLVNDHLEDSIRLVLDAIGE